MQNKGRAQSQDTGPQHCTCGQVNIRAHDVRFSIKGNAPGVLPKTGHHAEEEGIAGTDLTRGTGRGGWHPFIGAKELDDSVHRASAFVRARLRLFLLLPDVLHDLCGFPHSLAHVVELGPSNLPGPNDIDLLHARGMNRKHPFDADSV